MPRGKSNKRYTPEFKIMVIETMHREKLSSYETKFSIKVVLDGLSPVDFRLKSA